MKGIAFVNILIISVTLIVVAVPEGTSSKAEFAAYHSPIHYRSASRCNTRTRFRNQTYDERKAAGTRVRVV
jgi:hypothetical protein